MDEDFFTSSEPAPNADQIETPELEAIEPVETTQAETDVEAHVEPEPKVEEPKMVPLSAVQAEREKAREARDQANA